MPARVQPLRRTERLHCSLLIWTIPILSLFTLIFFQQFNLFGYNLGITFKLNLSKFQFAYGNNNYDYMEKVEYIANLPVLLVNKLGPVDHSMKHRERYDVICNPSWDLKRAMTIEEQYDDSLHPNVTNTKDFNPTNFGFRNRHTGGILPWQLGNMSFPEWLHAGVQLGVPGGDGMGSLMAFKGLPRFDTQETGVRYLKMLPFIKSNKVGKHFIENFYNSKNYKNVNFDFQKMEFNVYNGLIRFSDNSFKDWTVRDYKFCNEELVC